MSPNSTPREVEDGATPWDDHTNPHRVARRARSARCARPATQDADSRAKRDVASPPSPSRSAPAPRAFQAAARAADGKRSTARASSPVAAASPSRRPTRRSPCSRASSTRSGSPPPSRSPGTRGRSEQRARHADRQRHVAHHHLGACAEHAPVAVGMERGRRGPRFTSTHRSRTAARRRAPPRASGPARRRPEFRPELRRRRAMRVVAPLQQACRRRRRSCALFATSTALRISMRHRSPPLSALLQPLPDAGGARSASQPAEFVRPPWSATTTRGATTSASAGRAPTVSAWRRPPDPAAHDSPNLATSNEMRSPGANPAPSRSTARHVGARAAVVGARGLARDGARAGAVVDPDAGDAAALRRGREEGDELRRAARRRRRPRREGAVADDDGRPRRQRRQRRARPRKGDAVMVDSVAINNTGVRRPARVGVRAAAGARVVLGRRDADERAHRRRAAPAPLGRRPLVCHRQRRQRQVPPARALPAAAVAPVALARRARQALGARLRRGVHPPHAALRRLHRRLPACRRHRRRSLQGPEATSSMASPS